MRRQRLNQPEPKFSFGLPLHVILGNLTDRILRGAVTDFLHFYVNEYAWPSQRRGIRVSVSLPVSSFVRLFRNDGSDGITFAGVIHSVGLVPAFLRSTQSRPLFPRRINRGQPL